MLAQYNDNKVLLVFLVVHKPRSARCPSRARIWMCQGAVYMYWRAHNGAVILG
jgi:hypothetical protein